MSQQPSQRISSKRDLYFLSKRPIPQVFRTPSQRVSEVYSKKMANSRQQFLLASFYLPEWPCSWRRGGTCSIYIALDLDSQSDIAIAYSSRSSLLERQRTITWDNRSDLVLRPSFVWDWTWENASPLLSFPVVLDDFVWRKRWYRTSSNWRSVVTADPDPLQEAQSCLLLIPSDTKEVPRFERKTVVAPLLCIISLTV